MVRGNNPQLLWITPQESNIDTPPKKKSIYERKYMLFQPIILGYSMLVFGAAHQQNSVAFKLKGVYLSHPHIFPKTWHWKYGLVFPFFNWRVPRFPPGFIIKSPRLSSCRSVRTPPRPSRKVPKGSLLREVQFAGRKMFAVDLWMSSRPSHHQTTGVYFCWRNPPQNMKVPGECSQNLSPTLLVQKKTGVQGGVLLVGGKVGSQILLYNLVGWLEEHPRKYLSTFDHCRELRYLLARICLLIFVTFAKKDESETWVSVEMWVPGKQVAVNFHQLYP